MNKTKLGLFVGIAVMCSSYSYAFNLPSGTFPVNTSSELLSGSRATICRNFNAKVDLVNKFLEREKLSDTLRMSKDLCSYINLSEGQIEESNIMLKYETLFVVPMMYGSSLDHIIKEENRENNLVIPGADFYSYDQGTIADKFFPDVIVNDVVDLTREMELIVLSREGETQYLLYADADVNLKQKGLGNDLMLEGRTPLLGAQSSKMMAYRDRDNVAGGLFHRTFVENWAYQITGDPDSDGNYFCDENAVNASQCIPGGNSNSKFWRLDKVFPISSNNNTNLNVSKSTSVGFSIGASGEVSKDGPSAGIDVGFSFSQTNEVSTDKTVLTTSTENTQNDIGFRATFNISPTAVANLDTHNVGNLSTTDELFGASTWRDLDLSSYAVWRETVNSSNCTDGDEREMAFKNNIRIERGEYDIDGGNYIDYGDSSFAWIDSWRSFNMNTICQSSGGQYFRTFKPGVL